MKFVYFDMGGVLFSQGTRNTFKYLRNKNISENLIKYTLISNDSWNMRRGKISPEEFWEKVKEKDTKNASIIRDTWLNSYRLNPKMYKYSLDLKEKGFNLGLWSDTTKERYEYLKDKYSNILDRNIFGHFSNNILSFENGLIKQDLEFSNKIIEKSDNKKNDIIVIDDSVKETEHTRKIGLNVLIYDSNLQEIKKFIKN